MWDDFEGGCGVEAHGVMKRARMQAKEYYQGRWGLNPEANPRCLHDIRAV